MSRVLAHQTDILIAHPYKHHVLNLAAGCAAAGRSVRLAVPFYRKGLGRVIGAIPGFIGRKARGYQHSGIPADAVHQTLLWQLRKLWTLSGNPSAIERSYDAYIARKLLTGKWRARVVITLQDHMPRTSAAAKECGALLWSDQIINLSGGAVARINSHAAQIGAEPFRHDESRNDQVLRLADIVTAPSAYTLAGLAGRLGESTRCHVAPYGGPAAAPETNSRRRADGASACFTIVARAHSVRKGGHLLLQALTVRHARIRRLLGDRNLRIQILGTCERVLLPLMARTRGATGFIITHGDIPNADVMKLFSQADLFLMPTLSESMSLACVEAMRAGLPMLITRYAGVDQFVDQRMGYLIEDNVASVGDGIEAAIEHYSSLAQIWRLNLQNAASTLTWQHYENRIGAIAASLPAD